MNEGMSIANGKTEAPEKNTPVAKNYRMMAAKPTNQKHELSVISIKVIYDRRLLYIYVLDVT